MREILNYILVGQTPVAEPDFLKWAEWFANSRESTIVEQTEIPGGLVSTVFLGLDCSWRGGPPILFETMVFLDGEAAGQRRCSTWLEAEAQHRAVLAELRSRTKDSE